MARVGFLTRSMLVAGLGLAALGALPADAATPLCPAGAYENGSDILVVTSTDKPDQRRFTLRSGDAGLLRPEGKPGRFVSGAGYDGITPVTVRARLGGCAEPAEFRFEGRPAQIWRPIPLTMRPVDFEHDGVRFAGQLIERASDADRKTPVAVMVHGSSTDALVNTSEYGYLLAAQGVRAFLFDKRGTGGSGGTYTQDFNVLADDVVAAVEAVRKAVGEHAATVGLIGRSQGGWVAPAAAGRTPVDFVVVAFGLVASPLEEDALQVEDEMIRAGYGPRDIDEARQVSDATGKVMGSKFKDGLEALEAVKRRFADRPWLTRIQGEYTGDLVKETAASLQRDGEARFDNLQVPWHYDAVAALRRVKAPQLWLEASQDRDAPSHTTLDRLEALQREGAPIQLTVYPRTDHGMFRFVQAPDGSRKRTSHPPTYFRDIADWMLAQTPAD